MEFLSPKYLTEAYEILDKRGDELKICAGMTHLLRFYSDFPTDLKDRFKGLLHVGELSALADCREEAGRYSLGSTATLSSIGSDPYLARYYYAVSEAARSTSTPQIRNRRTLGGELGWGSYHSPLIVSLLACEARLRIRFRGKQGNAGHEDLIDLKDFYDGDFERASRVGPPLLARRAKTKAQDLVLKAILPSPQPGAFSFFRALTPKIHTENSGVVLAVSGTAQNGTILSARMVASGLWMSTFDSALPLDGTRMNDTYIFERLYSFCDRTNFELVRRGGPPAPQLGVVVFGLLKEGFSTLLGR